MRKLAIALLLLLALPLAADDLRKEIEARNAEMTAALERGDNLAVSRIYADDARIVGPRGQSAVGREAIDKYWTSIKSVKSWKLDVIEVGGTRDDAYQIGRSTLTSKHGEKESTYACDFVVIWRRAADGKLRIHLDLYN